MKIRLAIFFVPILFSVYGCGSIRPVPYRAESNGKVHLAQVFFPEWQHTVAQRVANNGFALTNVCILSGTDDSGKERVPGDSRYVSQEVAPYVETALLDLNFTSIPFTKKVIDPMIAQSKFVENGTMNGDKVSLAGCEFFVIVQLTDFETNQGSSVEGGHRAAVGYEKFWGRGIVTGSILSARDGATLVSINVEARFEAHDGYLSFGGFLGGGYVTLFKLQTGTKEYIGDAYRAGVFFTVNCLTEGFVSSARDDRRCEGISVRYDLRGGPGETRAPLAIYRKQTDSEAVPRATAPPPPQAIAAPSSRTVTEVACPIPKSGAVFVPSDKGIAAPNEEGRGAIEMIHCIVENNPTIHGVVVKPYKCPLGKDVFRRARGEAAVALIKALEVPGLEIALHIPTQNERAAFEQRLKREGRCTDLQKCPAVVGSYVSFVGFTGNSEN